MLYTPEAFPYHLLDFRIQKTRKRSKVKYINALGAFDIETTNIDKYRQAIMYIWQFQLDSWTIYGRTWDQFIDFKERLEELIPAGAFLVVYVHNLSFEFQFLKSIIPIDDVFAMDDRKILRIRSGQLEFRCSYIHSNMSLDRYLKAMNVPDKKVKGFDYTKKRYPWTPLTPEELKYCVNDVKGLVQAVRIEMEKDGDDIYSIPLTSTGYSRRLAKKALGGYRRYIKRMLPDLEVFQGLRKAFRGGDTHANRYNSDILIRQHCAGHDRSSSYPTEIYLNKFPRQFYKQDPRYFDLLYRYNKALLIHIYLENVRLSDPRFGDPYIPKAKCEHLAGAVLDNGRVLEAEHLDMWITEVDFEIIAQEYLFDYQIMELFSAAKSQLPDKFRQLIKQTYDEKTALKGVDDYLYNKKKNLFNSYYGMMVQNPCKPNYIFKDGIMQLKEESMEDLIKQYQAHGWLPYQWGVWVTAYARKALHDAMHVVDPDDFIYADTDSVKYIGDYDKAFEEFNRDLYREDCKALDAAGNPHYMGVFEKDAEYKAFKTMGAKKYSYIDENDELHITIAGVNKKAGAKELGSIENFKEGFVFRTAGGLEALYNDDPEIKEVMIQGHRLAITSNVALFPSSYTLGMAPDYEKLIRFLMNSDIRSSLHYER